MAKKRKYVKNPLGDIIKKSKKEGNMFTEEQINQMNKGLNEGRNEFDRPYKKTGVGGHGPKIGSKI